MVEQIPVKDKVRGPSPLAGASWHLIYQVLPNLLQSNYVTLDIR